MFMSAELAAGSLLDALSVSPWWMVAGTCVATAVAPWVAAHRFTNPRPEAWFAAATAATAGGWLTWSAGTTPWSAPSIAALVIAGGVLGPAYGLLRWRRDKKNQKEIQARAQRRSDAKRAVWVQILAKAGAKDITVGEDTAFKAGFKLELTLGPDAPDFRTLAGLTPGIERIAATATGLPIRPGSIQIERGMLANQAIMIVPTRDVLAETIELPELHGPRSINDPIATGQFVDGNDVELRFRGFHGMLAGMTNHGKSAALDVIMAQTTACVDNVTIALAGNKGVRWLRNWLLPWLRGHADRPPVDWVAANIDEALLVLLDIYRAIDARQAMPNNGVNGWEPNVENPQITILVDESTDLLESTKTVKTHKDEKVTFADLLLILVRTARSEAIQVVFCSQRGTATLLGGSGGDLKSQVLYRVGFRAQGNMTDVNAVFSTETNGVELSTLPKGAFYVEMEEYSRPRLAKGFWLTPERIHQYAIENTPYVGGLDTATADCMQHYAGRWTRPHQIAFLEQVNGGPLRPELMDALIAQDPIVNGIIAQAEAGDPGAQQLVKFAEELADQQERQQQGGSDSDEYDDGDLIARMRAWAEEKANSHDASMLELMWDQPEIDDAERNTADATALSANTLVLLGAIHAEGVLYSGEEWIPATDVLGLAVKHLGWPNNPEGGRMVAEALREIGVESTRKGGKRITSYPVEALRVAAEQHNNIKE